MDVTGFETNGETQEGGSVYRGEQVVASAGESTQQTEEIVAIAPEVAVDQAEWLPLGVFALRSGGQSSSPNPNLFRQLAIRKTLHCVSRILGHEEFWQQHLLARSRSTAENFCSLVESCRFCL